MFFQIKIIFSESRIGEERIILAYNDLLESSIRLKWRIIQFYTHYIIQRNINRIFVDDVIAGNKFKSLMLRIHPDEFDALQKQILHRCIDKA